MNRLWLRFWQHRQASIFNVRFVFVLSIIGFALCVPAVASAQYTSPSYKIQEVQTGIGGDNNLTSPSYSAMGSAGSLAVGSTTSSSYSAEAGFLTPNEPFLEFIVTNVSVNLGTLSASATASGTTAFSVRAYVNSGYTVQTLGNPPVSESNNTLTTLASPTASTIGTEQFGMNLVKNTNFCGAGCNLGADPVLVPGSTFASGQASTGYNTGGLFKYVKGDVIAQSGAKGWGKTNYTIAYIANIKSISKAGTYTMTQDLVAVATY
jgi:hypothetical protein